eukprot:COSAG05_NODE_659_length_8055_cov_3.528406_6_plen_84_part_00
MPMPLASIMANGDAPDAITLCIVAAVAGGHRKGNLGAHSSFRCLFCVLMGLLLCDGGACQGRGGRGDRGYTGRMHHWCRLSSL